MKHYTQKKNAKRAAEKQGLSEDEYTLEYSEGQGWAIVKTATDADAELVAVPETAEAETVTETPSEQHKNKMPKTKAKGNPERSDEGIAEAKQVFSCNRPNSTHFAKIADAKAGNMPTAPDFSAPTHKAYRKKLDTVVQAAEAGDADTVANTLVTLMPKGSSSRALFAYASLVQIALNNRQA